MPPTSLQHLKQLTDATGLLQHAHYGVPRRTEGYSADDNARGLILMARRYADAPDDDLLDLATVYLSFLDHAQDSRGHFRNFMDYDRQWSDLPASDDCHARCLWALGEVLDSPLPDHLRQPAHEMFDRGVGQFEMAAPPRSTAFFLMAAERVWNVRRDDQLQRLAHAAADRLLGWFHGVADDAWSWFEHYLTYANARLPHGLLAAYAVLRRPECLEAARKSLDFLIRETVADGVLEPVGNHGWYPRGGAKARFDQQPIEAMTMVEACLAAHRATGESPYADVARLAHDWFLGKNCHGLRLADPQRGSCHDGLKPDGTNANEGAESTLAFLISQQALDKSPTSE